MPTNPWPDLPVDRERFHRPPKEFGILPFWFLNGELEPGEMRYQLRQLCEKGMPGLILHGRYGLEMPYVGPKYLERIAFAVEEAEKLGMQTWIYDEMNWPSGTADKRVLQARPDLVERYIECINFSVRGPWFTYLTGADSRYNDFERSTPVAAFAIRLDAGPSQGEVVDLTPYLSFENVIPWEAPAGNWRLSYIVEKLAEYYIDALNPEATAEFLRQGYDPYARAVGERMSRQMLGFYTDEPAMHYYLSGAEVPIVPWTKEMFRRFQERNGYNLRPRLPDLFFDLSRDSARVRYDYYNTLTEFYSQAFYQQIHAWCRAHDVLFTGHLLYEEGLRRMVRVEGNLFKHFAHMDVVGVDHLYPIIGTRDRPEEHVALKVASSAAHQLGSPRLLCESFGGIFMDATMQRMKWITDWEYLLGVNLLNPHGFHYTLEGPRKRDWPPSQFYQYPWWQYYDAFSDYIKRLSHLLSGGRHVAKVAVLWPINAMFGLYTPQFRTPLAERLENDFNALTDLLLRLHYDYDYLDEDMLASAPVKDGAVRLGGERYECIILPPLAHLKLSTVDKLEQLVAAGGKALGMVFLPDQAYGPDGLVDVSSRIQQLFGVDPGESQANYRQALGIEVLQNRSASGGGTAFLRSYALARQLPLRLQQQLGQAGEPESPNFLVESDSRGLSRHFFAPPDSGSGAGERQEITPEVATERQEVAAALRQALEALVEPDVLIDNPEVFYLHRIKDGQDIYFLVNPTYSAQHAQVALPGWIQPRLWDPSTGEEKPLAPAIFSSGRTRFNLVLPPAGSAFILPAAARDGLVVETDLGLDHVGAGRARGHGRAHSGFVVLEREGRQTRLSAESGYLPGPIELPGDWEFSPESANALVLGKWLSTGEAPGTGPSVYADPQVDVSAWLPMVPGAWAYQLPAEPTGPYPLAVWYRIPFQVERLPDQLDLVVDGFTGSEWQLYVNGQAITSEPARSPFDAQMKTFNIRPQARLGENLVALRLVLTGPTDGLLDLLKLLGDFSLSGEPGAYRIAAPRTSLQPGPWTSQGYPYYSGLATYRARFNLPESFAGKRVFLDPAMGDDVLEVLVNSRPAGVRLWEPYTVEIGDLLQPGENLLELRVANTLVNLLEAVERPSGLAGVPSLYAENDFHFTFPE